MITSESNGQFESDTSTAARTRARAEIDPQRLTVDQVRWGARDLTPESPAAVSAGSGRVQTGGAAAPPV